MRAAICPPAGAALSATLRLRRTAFTRESRLVRGFVSFIIGAVRFSPCDSRTSDAGIEIVFVGGGQMAGSLIGGLTAAGHPAARIRVAEPDVARAATLTKEFGVQVKSSAAEVAAGADALVLAVSRRRCAKPCAAWRRRPSTTVISIAAGIRTRQSEYSGWAARRSIVLCHAQHAGAACAPASPACTRRPTRRRRRVRWRKNPPAASAPPAGQGGSAAGCRDRAVRLGACHIFPAAEGAARSRAPRWAWIAATAKLLARKPLPAPRAWRHAGPRRERVRAPRHLKAVPPRPALRQRRWRRAFPQAVSLDAVAAAGRAARVNSAILSPIPEQSSRWPTRQRPAVPAQHPVRAVPVVLLLRLLLRRVRGGFLQSDFAADLAADAAGAETGAASCCPMWRRLDTAAAGVRRAAGDGVCLRVAPYWVTLDPITALRCAAASSCWSC